MRRKKERKKQKGKGKPQTQPGDVQNPPSDEGGDENIGAGEEDGGEEDVDEAKVKESPRPTKKRKIESDSSASEVEQDPPKPPSRSPTPAAALPSFPLPVIPKAPSKATLALQGLDKALLNAELIDPALTIPLDALERPSGDLPVLSEKTKKRLVELGVSELFAGASTLIVNFGA